MSVNSLLQYYQFFIRVSEYFRAAFRHKRHILYPETEISFKIYTGLNGNYHALFKHLFAPRRKRGHFVYIDALTVSDATQVVTLAAYDADYWIVTYRNISSYSWQ